MPKLLMLVACLFLLSGCWGSTYPNWAECDGHLHLPRDSYSAPESVTPYLEACTQVLTGAGYKVVRENPETIFASKGEELDPIQGKLPRTCQVTAHSAPEFLEISITAKTRKYPHGQLSSYNEYKWTESHRDAMTELRQLVNQLMDLVDLRYPSPASK